jgi:transcriptional regulator with XRE-family HTH domain
MTSMRIAAVRQAARLSKARFAVVMNIDPGLLRKWESGAELPSPSGVSLLEILEDHPRLVQAVETRLMQQARWRIPFTKAKLQSITDRKMLIDSIILGRFVSNLRALLQADDQYEYEDHPARSRARVNGFILSAGILNEALTFTNYLAGKYKDLPEWTSGFGPMLKTVPQWFREYVRAVRNRGAFHYDDRSERNYQG